MTQEEALKILKTGRNVFLTGEPGSGKTYTINLFTAWLREHGLNPAVTASTGIAATHIGGMTIHSWSGIGVKQELSQSDLVRLVGNKRLSGRMRNTSTLIIDEISMLSAGTLSLVEAACRAGRESPEPFGGLQVVLVGDFFQLPPVVAAGEGVKDLGDLQLFPEEPESHFAFNSSAWRALAPTVCYLSEQHRQEDGEFLELLKAIRERRVGAAEREQLKRRLSSSAPAEVTQFFSHNAEVDRVNNLKLGQLAGEPRSFMMASQGPKPLVERLTRSCLSPETLKLKVGARVIFTKNDVFRGRFVNGTLGTVTGFAKDGGEPLVTTSDGEILRAEPMEWSIQDGLRILAKIIQVPLRLAWAITVHKSQGMSLVAAHMDLSATFEYGQGYVAISRVRTLSGLTLSGFNERALAVHPEIADQDAKFKESSDQAWAEFGSRPEAEQEAEEKEFIKSRGGSLEAGAATLASFGSGIKKPERGSSREETLALVEAGKTVAEAAAERGLTPGTIISHLEESRTKGRLRPETVGHLRTGQEEEIARVERVCREVGTEKLRLAFEKLGGQVPYETIRLARVLYKEEGEGK